MGDVSTTAAEHAFLALKDFFWWRVDHVGRGIAVGDKKACFEVAGDGDCVDRKGECRGGT
jgi:hypothetical protein